MSGVNFSVGFLFPVDFPFCMGIKQMVDAKELAL